MPAMAYPAALHFATHDCTVIFVSSASSLVKTRPFALSLEVDASSHLINLEWKELGHSHIAVTVLPSCRKTRSHDPSGSSPSTAASSGATAWKISSSVVVGVQSVRATAELGAVPGASHRAIAGGMFSWFYPMYPMVTMTALTQSR